MLSSLIKSNRPKHVSGTAEGQVDTPQIYYYYYCMNETEKEGEGRRRGGGWRCCDLQVGSLCRNQRMESWHSVLKQALSRGKEIPALTH